MSHKEIEIEQSLHKGVFFRLLKYARPYAFRMVFALLLVLAITALELYKPVLLGEVIDSFVESGEFSPVAVKAIVYFIVLLLLLVFNMIQTWILQLTGQQIVYNVREEVFTHVHKLSLRFFDITPVGRIVTRITNDVEALSEMFSSILVRLIKNFVKVVGLIIVMLMLDFGLAMRAFILLPAIIILTYVFKKVSRTCYRIARTKITSLNIYLSEHLSGMKLIQIFAREREKNAEFRRKNKELFRANFREVMVFAIFRPSIYLLYVIALVNIISGGSELVIAENNVPGLGITVGTLYIFIQYVGSFFDPIQEMAEQLGTLQQAMASGEKIFTILDEEPAIKNPLSPVSFRNTEDGLLNIKGRIEFKNVWFAYSGEDWVLKDVSFVIEPGQSVAFVGATGAGKSSILNLIGRYYDVNKGEILVDGVNIKDMDTDELRSAIGQVQQDVFVFTGDIKSNIRLRNEDITDEEIVEAARYVNADTFIEKLENAYEEAVTERGSTLSAGQRQLLSFARTLAYDPKILVMDEATANIDTETEQLIQEALHKLMKGRTTIVVAHRLSTIQHSDCIIVMHKGRIRERGTHQELLQLNGIYKKLYEIQKAAE